MRDKERSRGWSRQALALGIAFALVAAMGCNNNLGDGPDGFNDQEWARIRALEPVPTPPPPNPHNKRADEEGLAQLGHRLFYETGMTEPLVYDGPAGKMGDLVPTSCFTCHDSKYFVNADRVPIVQGGGTVRPTHDIPSILNMGWFDQYLWTGLFDSILMHNHFGTGFSASPLGYAKFLATNESYRNQYNELFDPDLDPRFDPANDPDDVFPDTGEAKPPMTADAIFIAEQVRNNIARAFEAYMRRLQTPDSPFGRYVRGDHTQLEPAAKRGLRLFIGKAACDDCHHGPVLSDGKFHNNGVPSSTDTFVLDTNLSANLAAGIDSSLDQGRAGFVFIQFIDCLVWTPDGSRCIVPGPFRRYLAGDTLNPDPRLNFSDATSEEAEAARAKFDSWQARDCLMVPNPNDPSGGLMCVPKPETVGAFRTPSLLNVAETGPYFHTGEAKTLEDVIWHYNRGGGSPGSYAGTKAAQIRPLGLTDDEVSDLVAFLTSLTADLPPSSCTTGVDPIGQWFVPPCP